MPPHYQRPAAPDSLLRSWLHLFAVTSGRDRRRKPRRVTPQSSGCEAERVQRCTSIAGDQVKAAIDAGAAGAISGSAIVKIIEQHINEPEKMLAALKVFVQPMKAATRS